MPWKKTATSTLKPGLFQAGWGAPPPASSILNRKDSSDEHGRNASKWMAPNRNPTAYTRDSVGGQVPIAALLSTEPFSGSMTQAFEDKCDRHKTRTDYRPAKLTRHEEN